MSSCDGFSGTKDLSCVIYKVKNSSGTTAGKSDLFFEWKGKSDLGHQHENVFSVS
jgi:hypothetical protein